MFEVKGLRAGYGVAEVLRGVDLSVGTGEAVAVLGPNGAGKTTLLRAIYQVCTVTGGSVTMDGVDLLALSQHQVTGRGIGHVPQGRGLFPNMTLVENLTMGAVTLPNKGMIREKMDTVMELFPKLQGRRSQAVGTMSGGEQQMVAIGRALMADPRLLLLDEPSLGLAPMVVEDIFEQLAVLSRSDSKMGILLVEQRVQEALDLCSKVYILQDGMVVSSGTSEEINEGGALVGAYFGEVAGSG